MRPPAIPRKPCQMSGAGIGSSLRRRAGFFGAGVLAALLLCHGPASAQAGALARHGIEQPAQPLGEALRAIARQTGASVLFDPGAVGGRQSRGVSGQLTAAEAISRAIDGTGLMAEVMKDGTIVVRAPVQGPAPVLVPAAPLPGPVSGSGEPREMARVEVTGSRLKRLEAEGPVPVNVYRAEDIDRSGQPTLERFLSSLNEVSVSAGEGAFGGTVGQGTVQLRGLPLGSTLVLVNGRRVQAVGSSSANFFNFNVIPLAAVERVEVVPVGSSAVYGGDALAGVVNIILKKSIDGQALDVRLSAGSGFEDGTVSIATGQRGENGSFLLLGAVSKATPLSMSERSFFRDADYRRYGGVDARSRICTPGTVTSNTAANLPGVGSATAGIPSTATGQAPTAADYAATAGRPTLCSELAGGGGYALVHGKESLGLHLAADHQLGAAWTVFGELTYTDDHSRANQGGLTLNNVLVPASNAYNPFGVAVRVTAALAPENGVRGFELNTRFTRVLGGLRGELAPGWELEATASTARDEGDRVLPNGMVNAAARAAALASASPATALNPFVAGRAGSEAVLRGIWTDNVRSNAGQKDQLGAFVRGRLLALPAGGLDAIVGVESARDRYETSIPGDVAIKDSRRFEAFYGELRAPLLRGDAAAGRGGDLAALTLAARRDKYSDFGAAATYQAGLEVRPSRALLMRASAASSFKPPTLLQTSIDDQSIPIEAFGLVDPARGNAPITGAEVVRGTNPGLTPEKGRAYTLGATWEPEAGTRLGVTGWRVGVDGLIGLLWPQLTLDNEALFPGFVTRAPAANGTPGAVTRVLYSEVNFGRVETAGVDLEASRSWQAMGGRWTTAASATRTTRYGVVIAPGSALESRLGRRYADYWAPAWKARLAVGYDTRAWSLGLTGRYLGTYKDAGAGDRQLGNTVVFDLAGRLDLKKLGVAPELVKAASVSAGLVNLTNRQPEYVGTAPYYDVTQADWRGRTASVRLSVDW